jgi:hypothetical protein
MLLDLAAQGRADHRGGPFYDSGDSLLVITGGSGQYAGAKGDMKLHARDAKGLSYVFVYELL